MRQWVRLLAAVVGFAVLAAGIPAAAAGATATIGSVTVAGSPFYPNGDGVRETVSLTFRLNRAARITVDVLDFDSNPIATLLSNTQRDAGTHRVSWNGRDATGARVDDGPYRFRVRAVANGAESATEARFTKAAKVIYPARPAAIVVAVDPGHGDVYSEVGRVTSDGTREAMIDLDIGLRLRDMLEGAGVRTTISRTLDQGANTPEWDRNDDGLIEYADELQARCDIANEGRADLYIAIHNNFALTPGIGGPSTYYWPDRPYAGQSYALAKLVQANMLARLDLYRTDTWYASRSHGVLTYPYFVLHEATPPRHPRPTFMPGVLSEGMFMTKPYELYLLKQPRVRQSMAAAYYDAIRSFIAQRSFAVGYTVLDAPTTTVGGSTVDYRLRLVNKGMQDANGWHLEARYVPAVTLYDGTSDRGELLAAVAVPSLGRGARATLNVSVPPPPAGDWLIKFDVVRSNGSPLSDLGSPMLQLALTVTDAP